MKEEWKVYIKGVPGRGNEVIKVLKDLGGKECPKHLSGANDWNMYYINHKGEINFDYLYTEIAQIIIDNYKEIKLPEKWKDGDILINNDGTCYKVFSEYDSDIITNFFAYNISISIDGRITENNSGVWACEIKDYRLATSTEVEHFFDLLHDNNKDWDPDKKQLIDLRWKPKFDEGYWIVTTTLDVNFFIWKEGPTDIQMFDCGNCFKTKEEAKIAAKKIKHLLKEE